MIRGLRDDDLFLLLDADELPTPEVLQFLKLYDGYSEPIRFGFRWTIFGKKDLIITFSANADGAEMASLSPLVATEERREIIQFPSLQAFTG